MNDNISVNGMSVLHREYRLAMYALGISTVLLVASGATVIAGASQPTGPTVGPDDGANITQLNVDQQQFNETLIQTSDSKYTLQQAKRTCGGALRLDSPARNSTSHQVGNVTVTLISHHDSAAVNELGHQRLAELVVEETDDRAGLSKYSQLEVQVNQYYESTSRDDPLSIAGIHVRPPDDCLPSARGTVNLANETVDMETARSDIDEVDLTYTDDIGALDQDDQELVERLIVTDNQTSYNVRTHLDTTALQATVTEVTANSRVDIQLQHPNKSERTLMLTVDLNAETVVNSWVEVQIDESNIKVISEGNESDPQNTSRQAESTAFTSPNT